MLELIVLLISTIVVICLIYYNQRDNMENFDNYYLSSCPFDYKSIYTNGNIICCNGEIVANKCISDIQCMLNGKGTTDTPNCVTAILEDYAQKGKKLCPPSFSYFEDKSHDVKGCTNGKLNDTLNGPINDAQQTCKIYKSDELNHISKDSCYNQKMMDEASCFGDNCTKQIIQPIPNKPVLIGIGFTDNMGIYKITYTRKSAENYLKALPDIKDFDLSRNINIAEVAKAYYIDRTMDKDNIQF